jgi:hypothetical protein
MANHKQIAAQKERKMAGKRICLASRFLLADVAAADVARGVFQNKNISFG